jgi:hypothetical protein
MPNVTESMKLMVDHKYFEDVDSAKPGHHFVNLRLDMFNRYSERVSKHISFS